MPLSMKIHLKENYRMGDLEFTPDGKKMFIIDDNHNGIKQYRCESAFELDTCEYVDGPKFEKMRNQQD